MTEQQFQAFLEEGFTEAQIEEIDMGMKANIPYVIYAKKNLMPQQMYQIRVGLQNNVEMVSYAKPEYDWFQLEEIRLGLEANLDVSKYDACEIPSMKMHQIRRGLEDGMDLTDFLKYDAGVISEIRKALIARVDILSYVEQGYEADQLGEIREAAEEGLDIFQYLDTEFRAVSIHEIAEGIRNNVDVEAYAKLCYSWSQMEQLRLGLMSQVDVSYYNSPLYDRFQMQEIRLGLEEGLEVDEYTSFMYPACEMRKIRLSLSNSGTYKGIGYDEEPDPVVLDENRDGITVSIAKDDMSASIMVNKLAYGTVTRKDILRSLRVMGVTQNIDTQMIDEILAGRHLGEMVPIAHGRPAENGQDGHYEFFFNIYKVRTPKINPDGSVDYQNTDWCEQVKREQKLAYYHNAGNGMPGSSVTGRRLPAKKGKELPILKTKGVILLPDKKTYIADTDGKVEYKGNSLEVSALMNIAEVNMATGNIKFEGTVMVAGDVTSGVTIEAGGDIVIDGFVEDASLIARGDILLKRGVNGSGRGMIRADGNIEAKFVESANISAGKSIKANYLLNSNASAGDSVIIMGSKGLILGGNVFAVRAVKVSTLGNAVGVKTTVKMGVSDEMIAHQRKVSSDLNDIENKLLVLNKGKEDLEEKYPPEIRNVLEIYINIENAIYTLNLEKKELVAAKEEIEHKIANTSDTSLTVSKDLYENVWISIDNKKMISQRATNVVIKKIDERITIV